MVQKKLHFQSEGRGGQSLRQSLRVLVSRFLASNGVQLLPVMTGRLHTTKRNLTLKGVLRAMLLPL